MKFILLSLAFISPLSAQELSCGQTLSTEESKEIATEVVTNVPSHLKGATIVITKADGSSESLKAEEYMVVKRKHNRPTILKTTSERSLSCKETVIDGSSKNIVSLKAVNSYGDPDVKVDDNVGTASISRQTSVGAQYQRKISDKVFVGVEGDMNKGAGVLIGIGF